MRKTLGYIWLALASALLATIATKLAFGLDGVPVPLAGLLAAGMSVKWPFGLLTLAILVAPRTSTEPPANLLEHSDRTWFARVLTGVSLVVLAAQAAAALI